MVEQIAQLVAPQVVEGVGHFLGQDHGVARTAHGQRRSGAFQRAAQRRGINTLGRIDLLNQRVDNVLGDRLDREQELALVRLPRPVALGRQALHQLVRVHRIDVGPAQQGLGPHAPLADRLEDHGRAHRARRFGVEHPGEEVERRIADRAAAPFDALGRTAEPGRHVDLAVLQRGADVLEAHGDVLAEALFLIDQELGLHALGVARSLVLQHLLRLGDVAGHAAIVAVLGLLFQVGQDVVLGLLDPLDRLRHRNVDEGLVQPVELGFQQVRVDVERGAHALGPLGRAQLLARGLGIGRLGPGILKHLMPVVGRVLDLLGLQHARAHQLLGNPPVGQLALHRRAEHPLIGLGRHELIDLRLLDHEGLGIEAERQVPIVGRIPGQVIEDDLAGEQVQVLGGEVLHHVVEHSDRALPGRLRRRLDRAQLLLQRRVAGHVGQGDPVPGHPVAERLGILLGPLQPRLRGGQAGLGVLEPALGLGVGELGAAVERFPIFGHRVGVSAEQEVREIVGPALGPKAILIDRSGQNARAQRLAHGGAAQVLVGPDKVDELGARLAKLPAQGPEQDHVGPGQHRPGHVDHSADHLLGVGEDQRDIVALGKLHVLCQARQRRALHLLAEDRVRLARGQQAIGLGRQVQHLAIAHPIDKAELVGVDDDVCAEPRRTGCRSPGDYAILPARLGQSARVVVQHVVAIGAGRPHGLAQPANELVDRSLAGQQRGSRGRSGGNRSCVDDRVAVGEEHPQGFVTRIAIDLRHFGQVAARCYGFADEGRGSGALKPFCDSQAPNDRHPVGSNSAISLVSSSLNGSRSWLSSRYGAAVICSGVSGGRGLLIAAIITLAAGLGNAVERLGILHEPGPILLGLFRVGVGKARTVIGRGELGDHVLEAVTLLLQLDRLGPGLVNLGLQAGQLVPCALDRAFLHPGIRAELLGR